MIYIDKLLPFKRKNRKPHVYKYEFEDVYEYENTNETHAGVRILEGPYKGLLYAYRKVQLLPNESEDHCKVKFEWFPIDNAPENNTQDLYDVLGDILVDIIEKNPPDDNTMDVKVD